MHGETAWDDNLDVIALSFNVVDANIDTLPA
jgi:hypothetical protein